LQGKIQSAKADIKEKANTIDRKVNKIKDDVAEKINDKIDASRSNRKNK
jgi:hypothetical protein